MAIWKQQPFFSWKKKFDIWHEPKVGNNLWPWIMGTVYLSFHKIEGSFFNARPKYERRHHRSWNISYHDDDESDYSLGRLIFSIILWIFYSYKKSSFNALVITINECNYYWINNPCDIVPPLNAGLQNQW